MFNFILQLTNLTTYKLGYKYKMGILCIFHPWDPERKRFRITHEFYKNGRLFAKELMTYWVKNRGRVVESMKEDVN